MATYKCVAVAPTNPLALRRCNVPWFKVMKPSNPADAAHSAGSIRPSSFGAVCINGTRNVPAARTSWMFWAKLGPFRAMSVRRGHSSVRMMNFDTSAMLRWFVL